MVMRLPAHVQILALILLISIPNFALAQPVTIAVGDWPPYISQEHKHDGVISHIITDIFTDMGMTPSISFMPWARAYKDTAIGTFTATGVWMHQTDREKDFIYSEPILTEQFVFFHKKSYPFNWDTVADLTGIKMGGSLVSSYGPDLDLALKQGLVKMERITYPRQNFKKLLIDRIQLHPLEINVGYSSLKKHFTLSEQKQITHHPKPLLNNLSYVLFPKHLKESKNLVKRFNQLLAKYKSNGQYKTYFNNFKLGHYNQ
ncbi:MAG: transporter substrate-binding domain-containing protein [Bermanella sp.]